VSEPALPAGLALALVDAFTTTVGDGNRAGVVLEAGALADGAKQAIAAAVGAAETAFVSPAEDAAFRLQWFTPSNEVPFCGHGTVAALHRLAETGVLAAGDHTFVCRAGTLGATIGADGAVWTDTPPPEWTELPVRPEHLCELAGADLRQWDRELPARMSFGNCFIGVKSRDALLRAKPAIRALLGEQERSGVEGVCLYTTDTHEADHLAFSRYFTPAHGIDEDAVTGSTNGPLAAMLAEAGVGGCDLSGGTLTVRNEQGDGMGQPGRVDVQLTGAPGAVSRIRIGSRAVTLLAGPIGGGA
jgi:PhzF family phenazine biosynthesis protein